MNEYMPADKQDADKIAPEEDEDESIARFLEEGDNDEPATE